MGTLIRRSRLRLQVSGTAKPQKHPESLAAQSHKSPLAGSPVGTYTITAGFGSLASGNYAFTVVDGSLTVSKATLTVVANDANRICSDSNPAFTATIISTGFKNGEALATSGVSGVASLTTTAGARSPVGTYAITAGLGSLAAGNYDFTFVDGTLTVRSAVSNVVVTEAATPRNAALESNESLKIAWTVLGQTKIASQVVIVGSRTITLFNGPANGHNYSCIIGKFAVGTHTYTIKTTNSKGVVSIASGTFTVVAPIPPTIANPTIVEALNPKNSLFEANEKLRLSWTATSQHGIGSQTVKVDGKAIAVTITGRYSCVLGPFKAGTHSFTIRSTDTTGVSSSITGTFTVVAPVPPAIGNPTVVEVANATSGKLDPNQKLKLTWTASSQYAIVSQTVKVNRKIITPISAPAAASRIAASLGSLRPAPTSIRSNRPTRRASVRRTPARSRWPRL